MKRIGLLLLAAIMAVGMPGCSGDAENAGLDLNGTWNYSFATVPQGGQQSSGAATISHTGNSVSIHAVGTWYSSNTGNSGREDVTFNVIVDGNAISAPPFVVNIDDGNGRINATVTITGTATNSRIDLTVSYATSRSNFQMLGAFTR